MSEVSPKLNKTGESVLLETPVFNVVSKDIENVNFSPVGLNCKDWITIIATDNGNPNEANVLLIRESRFGAEKKVLEFPFGTMEEGEKPIDAAKREFEEETGMEAENFAWADYGSYNPNPAYFNNQMHVFVATGPLSECWLKRSNQKLDVDEDCEPMILRFKSVERILNENGMNLSAIALWKRRVEIGF